MGDFTAVQRARIITLRQEGYSLRKIALKLGVSVGGVCSAIRKYNETQDFFTKQRPGRPPILNEQEKHHIFLQTLRNRKVTYRELSLCASSIKGTRVHEATIRRCLLKQGLCSRIAARKPFLRRANVIKRLRFAMDHKNWRTEWNNVLFTDESKFEIFGSRRRQFVRRRKGERYVKQCVQNTFKHGGGSIMVWGSISANGLGELVRIDGKLTGAGYRQILQNHGVTNGHQLIGRNFIFQQDNDPKHTARVTKSFLDQQVREGNLQTMTWPPQSPDLNIIEHVWEHMNRERVKAAPRNKEELWIVLQRAWRNFPTHLIKKLFESLPRRMEAVVKSRGHHSKY